MKKLKNKLISRIDTLTIEHQNHIINRLKLYDFARSAISYFCLDSKNKFIEYDYTDFKSKFKLTSFNPDREIESITYREIIDVGNNFIGDELADSIFVLNISTFENWILTILNHKMRNNTADIFKNSNGKSDKVVDISIIQESADIDELWDTIIKSYLQKLPYTGMKSMVSKLLKEYNVKTTDVTSHLIDKVNEYSIRRNIIVHNQKKVNDEYIRKSGNYAIFSKGDTIAITEELLFKQGDNLLLFMQDFRKAIAV